MKQILCVSVIMMVLLMACSGQSFCEEEGAKIIYLKGQVKVQRAGEDFWILAKKGMMLNEKDKVKTFIGSDVEIALDSTSKNVIRLEPNTEVTLEDLRAKKLSLSKGKIFALVEALDPGSSFEVRTPTAVAGVAGSGMSVGTDGKNTTVGCFEDKAFVQGVDVDGKPMLEIVIIEEGFKRVVGTFEMPGELIALTGFERDQWSQFRENLSEHLDWLREQRAAGSREAAFALSEIQDIQERSRDRWFEDKENIFEEREHQKRDDWEPPATGGGGSGGKEVCE